MILEACLIFKIEKKKTKKLFFCGKATVNPLIKKTRTRKTQITLLGHAPGFRSARENASTIYISFNFRNFSPICRKIKIKKVGEGKSKIVFIFHA
jgi:hypothetical protein